MKKQSKITLFLAILSLTLTFIKPLTAFAEPTERDYLKDDLERISATIGDMDLDDTINYRHGVDANGEPALQTQEEIIGELLNKAKEVANDENKTDEIANPEIKKAIQELKLALVNPRLLKDSTAVPEGEIFENLIPQLIRLAFKVAWIVIFISFMLSGIYMILYMESEDRLTKAKHILYYSIIGFIIITLAFAIVKAVTNIDFFGTPQ